ncbi:light-harvesting protein [Rhodocyclus tenuis]|uniref:Light-harvesting polypeptide B-800/860 alpha chain n=2 Tax=Rhodocyclus tenuis TaxID=1066 RepID=LHA_RHOTE|nr:light-harvesting protein [Rhodocyclus tenuis]P80586.1 RecName: Full=Light-harvesting polypeptide B-800/860 alpha chain; AltName: Full=Antenna pigment polypeptide alpha chain; AltName: Full=LH-2 [Rhodocyclus tenuis]MBB4246178.1 hypothetical protein [Rhodocyclus tenuis]MBK1681635.1 hypothetical protein [Rhodocyclus tenuis]
MTNGKIWLVVKPTVGLPIGMLFAALLAVLIHGLLFVDGRLKSWWSEFPVAKPAVVSVQAAPAPVAAEVK